MPVPLLGWAIRRRHSAVDEERGGRVVARHIYQKSMYPPKVVKKPPVSANYVKFADHFLIWTTRNGNLKFHSKLREIRSIRQPPRRITRNPRDFR